MEPNITEVYKQRAINAQYHVWHPKVKHLCFKSQIIKLSQLFTSKYLLSDGVYQPEDDPEYSDDSSDVEVENLARLSPKEKEALVTETAILRTTITEYLENSLSGAFVKLNWSSCRDALWVNP